MIKALRQELQEALGSSHFRAEACAARTDVLDLAHARTRFRRENAAYLSASNTEPEALQVIENSIAQDLQAHWDARKGEPGIPTNDPTRKRLIEQALAASTEYQSARLRCLDVQAQAEMLEEEYQAARRRYGEAMAAWWQSIFALAPDLALGDLSS